MAHILERTSDRHRMGDAIISGGEKMRKIIRQPKRFSQKGFRKMFQQKAQHSQHSRRHQKGVTGITMVMILLLIALFTLILLRLFPIYMEYFSVTSHLNSLATESGSAAKTNAEIISTLQKRFSIDDVKNVTSEHIFIERGKDGLVTVAIEYEVRTTALANIDMVVTFVDEVDLK
ncbi:DUF4845 domain-containing protein [Beggiatoa alba]|nr:DUF4845 domain-containing protein [Beggiatoa alba]